MDDTMEMVASVLKDQGNAELKNENYEEAINLYSQAIDMCPNNHILYSNRSVAYCKVNKFHEALADGEKTVSIKPVWVKGYFRKGAALVFLNRWKEAGETFEYGLVLEPDNQQLKDALADCRAKTAQMPSESSHSLPQGWEMRRDNTGRPYYVNHATHTTTWVAPTMVAPVPVQPNRQHEANPVSVSNIQSSLLNNLNRMHQRSHSPQARRNEGTSRSSSSQDINTSQPHITRQPVNTSRTTQGQNEARSASSSNSRASSHQNINTSQPLITRQPVNTSSSRQTSDYQPRHVPSPDNSVGQSGLAKGPTNSLRQGPSGISVRGADPTLRKGPSGLAKGSQLFQGIRSESQPGHEAKGPDNSLLRGPSSISVRGPDSTLQKGPAGLAKGSQLFQGLMKDPSFSTKNL